MDVHGLPRQEHRRDLQRLRVVGPVSLHDVLDMVGGAYEHGYIRAETAVNLLAEHGRISPVLAARLLLDRERDWTPVRDWNGWKYL